ncbi:glycosyltransferase [Billgrantia antri]|uniref:Glycosyltransferase n=1 Tax=Halomonas sulfidivorans TaxID=2733488 RepID=A0ABX7WES5_9GAMM|nr:glycosyltransferase [Halomonas sulfidivorans]QTP58899.1 glycosyltransferase [Halomonas sulfidivorans]
MSDVLFIVDHLDTGGAPVVVRNLCVALMRKGAKVTLVVLSDRISHQVPSEIELYRLPFIPKGRWQRQRRYHLHARKLNILLASLGDPKPSLVVAHLHHAHQVVRKSCLSAQAWYCLHSDPEMSFLGNKRAFARMLKRCKVRSLYSSRRLIGVSQGVIDSLHRSFGVEGRARVVIQNPLDLETIVKDSQEPINDVPDEFLIFVGRLEQRSKRFDRLLKAYRDSGINHPLVVIGEGKDRVFIEKEIERLGLHERVILLGHRDNPYAYMKRAHALILSSDYEGFSLVIAEALACGTPVVSTDCPSGPREILTGELARYLVMVDDNVALASSIREVMETPPNVSSGVVSHLAADNVAAQYLALSD